MSIDADRIGLIRNGQVELPEECSCKLGTCHRQVTRYWYWTDNTHLIYLVGSCDIHITDTIVSNWDHKHLASITLEEIEVMAVHSC